jgi:hypothetical protein
MKIKKIEEISIEESKMIYGGASYSDDCSCSCSCDCDCSCDCPKEEKQDEIAGKAATYVEAGLKLVNKAGEYAGTSTGDKANDTMTS